MRVEVAYALPDRQWLEILEVEPGTTAAQAAETAVRERRFPAIDVSAHALGVFGRPCPPERVLRADDRVEILRPLQVDPKTARRHRAGR